ncbi:MAG: polynucleotide adenylyltransferase, partial [Romboutsia sp.]|nr:polynucleotide adenylyltransferase [Romboutsia sp.]
MEIFMPKEVKFLIDKIYENGYEAFMVGGCVRDSILNMTPNDYDITTNAKPSNIIHIFKEYKILDTGIKHGTVSIILNDNIYEITTYRIEGEYENNRRPKNVEFTSNLEDDLRRRDFTINAIAYNEKFGIVDIFNGIKDIQDEIIKTV